MFDYHFWIYVNSGLKSGKACITELKLTEDMSNARNFCLCKTVLSLEFIQLFLVQKCFY